jgi:sugar phosphate isomerase/epimerase
MKPGAKALFIEPLGESKMLDFIRNHVFRIHHGHVRDVDAEHPLTYADIRAFGQKFRECEFREFQLTEMIARITGDRFTRAIGLRVLDEMLLRNFPELKRFCRLVVIQYVK